jgi:hypothetical protein
VALTPLVVVLVTVVEGIVEVELVVIVLPTELVVVITITVGVDFARRALIFDSRAAI